MAPRPAPSPARLPLGRSRRAVMLATLAFLACGDGTLPTEPEPLQPTIAEGGRAGGVKGDKGEKGPGRVAITPEAISLRVGESAAVSATVLNPVGHVIPNQPVTFGVSDASVASVAATGQATATVTALSAGSATLSGVRNERSGTASVEVRKWTTKLITADAETDEGSDVTLSATLTREDGSPVAGAEVLLHVGGDVSTLELETDGAGVASVEVGSELSAGAHGFTFAYAGDAANESSSASGTMTVAAAGPLRVAEVEVGDFVVGTSDTLRIRVVHSSGAPAAGLSIQFSWAITPYPFQNPPSPDGLFDMSKGVRSLTTDADGWVGMRLPGFMLVGDYSIQVDWIIRNDTRAEILIDEEHRVTSFSILNPPPKAIRVTSASFEERRSGSVYASFAYVETGEEPYSGYVGYRLIKDGEVVSEGEAYIIAGTWHVEGVPKGAFTIEFLDTDDFTISGQTSFDLFNDLEDWFPG